jgi:CHAT domain-containing protein/Tfp pilus assembly protein PilF
MPALRFGLTLLFGGLLLTIAFGCGSTARAQTDDELEALNNRILALRDAGKYAEALPLAEQYLEATKQRHGEEHESHATALNNLGVLLDEGFGRFDEAEKLKRRALSIDEKLLGPDHAKVARGLNNLGVQLRKTNRSAEAEPLLRRALAIDEQVFGPDHPNVATSLSNMAELMSATNRPADAEQLIRRALAIDEKHNGPEHYTVAIRLTNLAVTLEEAFGRYEEAEQLKRRVIAILEKVLGPEHPQLAAALNNLSVLLRNLNRHAEAEQLMRRALVIDEKAYGPDHPNIALRLNNLAELLRLTNRPVEAELLYRRSLSIYEKVFGPEHPDIAIGLNNLALLLANTNRAAEAEPMLLRAVGIMEKSFGPDHPKVATALSNLAALLDHFGRNEESEAMKRRALAIDEKSLGPEHPDVGLRLNNLATSLSLTGRHAEAKVMMRRVIAIFEKALGPEHPNVAAALGNLSVLHSELGEWTEALELHRRATPLMSATKGGGKDRTGLVKAVLSANTAALRGAVRGLHRAVGDTAASREEAFQIAQWALQTAAADALGLMTARFAKGDGPLARAVRERQDLIARRQSEDRLLLAAVGRGDAAAMQATRASLADLDGKLDVLDQRLDIDFPEFAQLANPMPLSIAAVQAILRPNEVLVVYLDVPQFGRLPEETLAWAITKTRARWISIPLGSWALAERVVALRCGLDASNWQSPLGWPDDTPVDKQRIGEQQLRRQVCTNLIGKEVSPDELPPFDFARAYELYQGLLAPFADLTKGKHLIIVPSGLLGSLPFQVLVTKPPVSGSADLAAHKRAAWLAFSHPVTVLPSVGSLQALRKLPPSAAKDPYVGFGNPLLDGSPADAQRALQARTKQSCMQQRQPLRQRVAASNRAPVLGRVSRSGTVDLAELRAQAPLPETADELCAVAQALGGLGREADTVWLGARASESNLKALSKEGKLKRHRVVHFATHGLLSGESEAILRAKAEPALLLNPPADGRSAADLEMDDGLLTASEVAQLDLDADWVVLSACNTAAGQTGDTEALSGLARAFFYARARALLVSHWYVSSDAAVKLITRTFAELRANPGIGRAEALRRSMAALIRNGGPSDAHPSIWAPFVVVGEGAGSR